MIFNRIYSDYLMPSRLGEYQRLLEKSLGLGYQHLSMIEYHNMLETNSIIKGCRYFIHRHDIDTDLRTAKKMFEIERSLLIKSTYYFRLSTLDYVFMKEITEYGSEASYHFEELSDYCKNKNIKTRVEALTCLNEIRSIFKQNVTIIERESGTKLRSVAVHGDFVNRELGVPNNIITDDLSLRKELAIECESYDKKIMDSFELYIIDDAYPTYYSYMSPFQALEDPDQNSIICLTSHPRHWETNWKVNTIDNVGRAIEGFRRKKLQS